jgi:uncharacterized membrane protein
MNILLVALLIAAIDLPWLLFNADMFQKVFTTIQGGRVAQLSPISAIPVYIALAYLLTKAETVQESFLVGASTYAVYDFTMLATLKDYPLSVALMDTFWGGTLLAITRYVLG